MHYWADVHLLSLKKQQDYKWLQTSCIEKQTVLFSDHWSIALIFFFDFHILCRHANKYQSRNDLASETAFENRRKKDRTSKQDNRWIKKFRNFTH